jgi:hypothetical protein
MGYLSRAPGGSVEIGNARGAEALDCAHKAAVKVYPGRERRTG